MYISEHAYNSLSRNQWECSNCGVYNCVGEFQCFECDYTIDGEPPAQEDEE